MQTALAAEKEEHPPYKRASCPYLPLHVYYTTPAALALCCRSGLLESTTFLIPQFRGGIGIQGLAERATRKRQVTVATPVWLTLALPALMRLPGDAEPRQPLRRSPAPSVCGTKRRNRDGAPLGWHGRGQYRVASGGLGQWPGGPQARRRYFLPSAWSRQTWTVQASWRSYRGAWGQMQGCKTWYVLLSSLA